jgi:hypothetical protein
MLACWGLVVEGMFSELNEATQRVAELAKASRNEFYVKGTVRRSVVARVNDAGIPDN